MKVYDITATISETIPIYEGDPDYTIMPLNDMSRGDICNTSLLQFCSHLGTHCDAPKHFVDEAACMDEVPVEKFMGRAKVIDFSGLAAVSREDLAKHDICEGEIILLKTDNKGYMKQRQFKKDFVHLTDDGAAYLIERKIKAIGIDYLSVEGFGSSTHGVHINLFKHGIPAVEGLVLDDIAPGEYTFIGLPLKIRGGNGSPIRAVLIEE